MEALFTEVFGLQPGAPAKVHFDRRIGEWVDPRWAGCTGDAALVRGTAGAIDGRAGAA
jgi:hypothetical protein